jgi:hypothetical protein
MCKYYCIWCSKGSLRKYLRLNRRGGGGREEEEEWEDLD